LSMALKCFSLELPRAETPIRLPLKSFMIPG
jgi:hypothetical protein